MWTWGGGCDVGMREIVRMWQKNWPEVMVAARGGMPSFVFRPRPEALGTMVPAFCYHDVQPEEFRRDLQFLRHNGYTTLSADELADHLEGKDLAPPRSVVLTIDDGGADLFTQAYPLLCEFEMIAVAFVCPGLHTDDADPSQVQRLCTWDEMMEMHLSGLVDFQSHTLEHRFVPRWPEPVEFRTNRRVIEIKPRPRALPMDEDLAESKRMLQERLGKRVEHLAFPNYEGSKRAIAAGRNCGYRGFWWGVLPERRGNSPGDPLMEMVRISGEYLRRLPGEGRVSLGSIALRRCGSAGARWAPRRKRVTDPIDSLESTR